MSRASSATEARPLSAAILDGRAIAAQVWAEVEVQARELGRRRGVTPRLAVLRVGDDPASVWYARSIERAFAAHQLVAQTTVLPATSSDEQVEQALRELAREPGYAGLLVQLPLPTGHSAERLVELIPPERDVEGLNPLNAGHLALGRPRFVPSTALAGLEVLMRSGIELRGRLAVVVGRSQVVGRPLASLLLQADCTVIQCHSRTAELAALTRQADLLLAAAGRPGLVDGTMLKPGAVVIDFGTTEVEGSLVGDVDFPTAVRVASAITPVPGGVGPVTTAVLGRSLIQAALGLAPR